MNKTRRTKAQAFIIVIIILLAFVLIFVILSYRSSRVRAAPLVAEAFWEEDDQNVTSTTLGQRIEAHVVIKAVEEYSGSIVVKIRKDISFWPDRDYYVSTVPVTLKADETKELQLTFTPDEASSSRLRGYFMEAAFQATGTSWVMESSYPPRLTVQA